jgi:hypothetical protein
LGNQADDRINFVAECLLPRITENFLAPAAKVGYPLIVLKNTMLMAQKAGP